MPSRLAGALFALLLFSVQAGARGGGGCFPAGTRISTPDGVRAIETLSVGDFVMSHEGTPARIQSVEQTRDELVNVITGRGVLTTTASHPLLDAGGSFTPVGEIIFGCRVVVRHRATKVLAVVRTGSFSDVYNLTVDEPHTFIAEGFAVHNKGGGGGGGGGGHSSGGGGSYGAHSSGSRSSTTATPKIKFSQNPQK